MEQDFVEVSCLKRGGFTTRVHFRAQGDGSQGPLPDPRKSRLWVGGASFRCRNADLVVDRCGDQGAPGLLQGVLEFYIDAECKATDHFELEYAGKEAYQSLLPLRVIRQVSTYQAQVGQFLGGYLSKEAESAVGAGEASFDSSRVAASVLLPDVPQQERTNDCGYFVLEQILRSLQLAPEALRALARASAQEVTALTWPTQQQVAQRKLRLREALGTLLIAARRAGHGDVDALLKGDTELRRSVQATLWDGPSFSEGVGAWAARRPGFSSSDLAAMPIRGLRDLCVQYGVLPSGTVDKSDLVAALTPHAVDAVPATATSGEAFEPFIPFVVPTPAVAAQAAGRGAPRPAKDFLAGAPFSSAELEGLPSKTLRTLCMQNGVLPSGPVERCDLLTALAPMATDAKRRRVA